MTAPMPALYLGHGAPPLLDDSLWVSQLQAWARALPRPAGILIASAHWERAPVTLSAAAAGRRWSTTSRGSRSASIG